MAAPETNADAAEVSPDAGASELGLRALVWTLADPRRAMRLIDVTGLDPRDLKARLNDPAVLAATLAFLEGHEPDLVECAETLGRAPAELVAARMTLEAM